MFELKVVLLVFYSHTKWAYIFKVEHVAFHMSPYQCIFAWQFFCTVFRRRCLLSKQRLLSAEWENEFLSTYRGSNCEKTHPPTNNCRPFSGHTDILWHVGILLASVSRFSRPHGVTAGRDRCGDEQNSYSHTLCYHYLYLPTMSHFYGRTKVINKAVKNYKMQNNIKTWEATKLFVVIKWANIDVKGAENWTDGVSNNQKFTWIFRSLD